MDESWQLVQVELRRRDRNCGGAPEREVAFAWCVFGSDARGARRQIGGQESNRMKMVWRWILQ